MSPTNTAWLCAAALAAITGYFIDGLEVTTREWIQRRNREKLLATLTALATVITVGIAITSKPEPPAYGFRIVGLVMVTMGAHQFRTPRGESSPIAGLMISIIGTAMTFVHFNL